MECTDKIGLSFSECGRSGQRYNSLTELIFQLLDKVDEGKITRTVGIELSFLGTRHQAVVNNFIEKENCSLSIKQAKQVCECYENEYFIKKYRIVL